MDGIEPASILPLDVREADLAARFEPRIRYLASRHVHPDWVDDLVQEVLAAVLEALRVGRLEDPQRLPAFVHGVTRNAISNWARANARWRRASELDVSPATETDDPLQLLLTVERRKAVVRCLDALRQEDRRILYLSFYQGLSSSEVAKRLGIEPHVARQRKWRALKRFEKLWRES